MNTYLIRNAKIVNEGAVFEGDILIENEIIKEIAEKISPKSSNCVIIDAEGSYVIPGAIDDQVHFREPGLTHKGTIETESRAAVAGGMTSFIKYTKVSVFFNHLETSSDSLKTIKSRKFSPRKSGISTCIFLSEPASLRFIRTVSF